MTDTHGKPLWDFQAGGAIGANPVSFTIDGGQRIAIAAGRVLYAFGLWSGSHETVNTSTGRFICRDV